MTRLIRLISIVALTSLTACGGLAPRTGGGLAQMRLAQASEAGRVMNRQEGQRERRASDTFDDLTTMDESAGHFTAFALIGVALLAGLYLAHSRDDDGGAADSGGDRSANADTPDFVRAALDGPPGL